MPENQSYEVEAQQKIRALEAEVQRLTELPKVVLIFPGDRVITLPDVTRPKLRKLLIDNDIADKETYCKLFGTDTTLLLNRVDDLFAARKWTRAIPFERADASKALGKQPFQGSNSLPGMIEPIVDCLNKEIKIPNRQFRIRDDDEKRTHCDCRDQVDEPVLRVQSDISGFLLERGHSNGDVRAIISQGDAGDWINGNLKDNMTEIAKLAAKKGVIFHEPHHELTPGMLLIDEIFRRMVKEVADLVADFNHQEPAPRTYPQLQEFVNGLAGKPKGLGSNFGPFIMPAGDHRPPGVGKEPLHVDPSRIELLVEPNGKIRSACVIVGAWKGGTHSAGHTSP